MGSQMLPNRGAFPQRRVRQLSGRRGRGQNQGRLWRQLRAAQGNQEQVRSNEFLPAEPKHQAGLKPMKRSPTSDLEATQLQSQPLDFVSRSLDVESSHPSI